MSRIITIARRTIVQNLRDTGNALGQMLIFPILLIFILGNALAPMYDVGNVDPTLVGYLNEDSGPMGRLADEFMNMPEVKDLLDVRPVDSVTQGNNLLQDMDITALIHIPGDYSTKVIAGQEAEIVITVLPGRTFRGALVETVMESFICGSNATQAMLAMGNPQPEYRPAHGTIEDQPFSVSGLMPDAMDYYAVTMLVMIVMYGTMYGAYGMAANNLYPVGRRVKASPVRPGEQYIGTTIGNVATIFVSSLVIIAFSHFAYGVNWGDNLFLILLITFLHVILAVGLGSMAIAVMRDEKRASVLINLLVIAWTFLAGGYFKITLPSAFSWIQYFSPSFLVQTALFNTIYGGPFSQTLLMLAAMIGIILLSGIIGIAAERRSGQ